MNKNLADIEEQIKQERTLCVDAIAHVLRRIRDDDKVRYHLGVGTAAFEKLTAAYAKVIHRDVDFVRDSIIPGSASIHKERV